MWEKEHAAHSDYFSRCKVAFKDFFFIAAWPGLCKSLCFKVQIKTIDCSYFNKRVKERFCHEPPTLHFWAGRHDCGPVFHTGGRPWLFGEMLELLVRPDRKASEQMAFTADWIGSLFRWQSSLIVGEPFFFVLWIFNRGNHQTYWYRYRTGWNGDLFVQELVFLFLWFPTPCALESSTFITLGLWTCFRGLDKPD